MGCRDAGLQQPSGFVPSLKARLGFVVGREGFLSLQGGGKTGWGALELAASPLGNGMEEQEGEGRIQKAEEEKGNERRRRRERERGLFAEDVCTSASSSSSSLCLSSPAGSLPPTKWVGWSGQGSSLLPCYVRLSGLKILELAVRNR